MYCRGCRKEFDRNMSPICPFCGVDSRNPIEYTYSKADRFLIKTPNIYEELLMDLDPVLLLIEEMNLKENLKDAEYHGGFSFGPINEYYKFISYRYSLVDFKYDIVKSELKQNFPDSKITEGIVRDVLDMAFESIAKNQHWNFHWVTRRREDYNSLLKMDIRNDYLVDSRIKLKKIKEEKVKQYKTCPICGYGSYHAVKTCPHCKYQFED